MSEWNGYGKSRGTNPTENRQPHSNQDEADRIMADYEKLVEVIEKQYSLLTKAVAESQARIAEMINKISAEKEAAKKINSQYFGPDFEKAIEECVKKVLNKMGVSLPPQQQPSNLSFSSISHNFVVPQQSNGTNQMNCQGSAAQHQIFQTPTPTSTAIKEKQRYLKARTQMPLLHRAESGMSHSNKIRNAPLRPQQQSSHQKLPQTPQSLTSAPQWLQQSRPRMQFSSSTALLPSPPIDPTTHRSPAFPSSLGPRPSSSILTPNLPPQQHPCSQSLFSVPPPAIPLNLSLEQYQAYYTCVRQAQIRLPPAPPSTPSKNESLQPFGNPCLQPFPRLPFDPQENEKLNLVLHAPSIEQNRSLQCPPAQLQHPPQLQQQLQQPPQTPSSLSLRRTRKRKTSPKRCYSKTSRPETLNEESEKEERKGAVLVNSFTLPAQPIKNEPSNP